MNLNSLKSNKYLQTNQMTADNTLCSMLTVTLPSVARAPEALTKWRHKAKETKHRRQICVTLPDLTLESLNATRYSVPEQFSVTPVVSKTEHVSRTRQ